MSPSQLLSLPPCPLLSFVVSKFSPILVTQLPPWLNSQEHSVVPGERGERNHPAALLACATLISGACVIWYSCCKSRTQRFTLTSPICPEMLKEDWAFIEITNWFYICGRTGLLRYMLHPHAAAAAAAAPCPKMMLLFAIFWTLVFSIFIFYLYRLPSSLLPYHG